MSKNSQTKVERDDGDDDVNALFRLPLAEFTGARNALSAGLKKSGRGDEAGRVKALGKPSVSAWAVNQLYWNHREAFDRLIASGERFHKAQTSRSAGKVADMRAALEARREVLAQLSDLATSLLRDAGSNPGQNPSLDTIRRITTTLEGISAFASRSDGRHRWRLGRLTEDVDPPGFESFGSFVPSMRLVPSAVAGGSTSAKRKRTDPPATAGGTDLTTAMTRPKAAGAVGRSGKSRQSAGAVARRHGGKQEHDARQLEETRKARLAAAKVSLQHAKRSLTEARAVVKSLEAAQKKADAEAKQAEKRKRDAEQNLEKAKAASEAAAGRARSVAVELEDAASEVDDAERSADRASKELEHLLEELRMRKP